MAACRLLLLSSLLAPGLCALARVKISSMTGGWSGYGKVAAGRALSSAGRIFYGGDFCQPASLPLGKTIVVVATAALCPLEEKIKNAINNNASALLLLLDKDFISYETDIPSAFYRYISVIFIPYKEVESVLKLINNSQTASAFISADELYEELNINQSRKNLLVLLTILIVMSILGGCYGLWYYHDQIESISSRNACKLQADEDCAIDTTIDKIPSRTLMDTNEKVIEDYHTCAVCFENYKLFEIISSLPCSHIFHKNCVHPWLAERRSCPLCKMDILKHYGLPAASSEESILNLPLDDVVTYLEGVQI